MLVPNKLITSGQTGVELGALVGAKSVGISTGGTAPRGFITERGAQESVLKEQFQLVPHPQVCPSFCLKDNIDKSDITLIFSVKPHSKRIRQAIELCVEKEQKHLIVDIMLDDSYNSVQRFLTEHNPMTINIIGNQESTVPGIAIKSRDFIKDLFKVN